MSSREQPVLLFVCDGLNAIDYRQASHVWIAREVGFRSYVVDWKCLKVEKEGMVVSGGHEVLSQNERVAVGEQERIVPDVIIHRKMIRARSRALFAEFGSAYPKALISYDPLMQRFCGKWAAELCFRAREDVERVPRPATYLHRSSQIQESLREVGGRERLIFKPSIGTRCFGIRLSSPETFSDVSKSVRGSRWGSYVVQQLIEDPVLLEGRKFDLRIYALITSFAPLSFRVYREGVTRIAAREFDPNNSDTPLVSLTGDSFRKRMGEKPINVPVTALLRRLSEDGYKTSDFWEKIEKTLGAAFRSFADHCARENVDMIRRFYIAGADILLERDGDSFKPLFLETNYYPQLNGWGPEVDLALRRTHREWLTDLFDLCQKNRTTEADVPSQVLLPNKPG